jgi:hypothetical protein
VTAVDDLATWFTQIWDEREQAARDEMKLVEYAREAWRAEYAVSYQWVRNVANNNGSVVSSLFAPGAPTPQEVLARIAADRQILALHHPDRHLENWFWLERECAECKHRWHKWLPDKPPTEIGPEQGCPTVRLLALPYADRPGYQEAWRPA